MITIVIVMAAFSVAPLVNVARNKKFNKDYDLWQATGGASSSPGRRLPT